MKLVSKWRKIKKQKQSASGSLAFRRNITEIFDASSYAMEAKLNGDRLTLWKQQKLSNHPISMKRLSIIRHTLNRSNKLELIKETEDLGEPLEAAEEIELLPEEDPEYVLASVASVKKTRIDLLSNIVVENLDREKVSNRGAVGLVGATAASLGYGLDELSLSKSTCQRKRKLVCTFSIDILPSAYDFTF